MRTPLPQALRHGTFGLASFAVLVGGTSAQAAIIEALFDGEVDSFVGTNTTSLAAAFPAQTSASFTLRYDDAIGEDPFNPGIYPAAGTLVIGVNQEQFRVDDANLFASGAPFGPFSLYGLGLEAGTGTPTGTGGGFTISGIDFDDFSVGATGTPAPATTDVIDVFEAFDALGDNTPLLSGSVRISFDDLTGNEAGSIVFNITDFVSSNVPEPASLALIGAGVGLLALRRR